MADIVLIERFWQCAIKRVGCWGWRGYDNGDGYGVLQTRVGSRKVGRRKITYAHRLSWEIHRGPIPKGLFVLHKCDNPNCTNPRHLFIGTNKDNMIDCVKKGRDNRAAKSMKGEKNPNAKLTANDVRAIRRSKASVREEAKRFGINFSLVSAIRRRKAWSHVN